MKINIPNQITLGRLVLALIFFVLLSLFDAANNPRWLLLVCFWVFLIAALSDILDGLLARTLKQVTTFGRVLDPIVDKVMVCGAFVLFAGPNFVDDGHNITGVVPWMVIVILMREFLVSGIRAHAESTGREFAATWAGKLKMFVQSATVCVILGQLGWKSLAYLAPLRTACVWLTVIVTALSIIAYLRRAQSFLLTSAALHGEEPVPDDTAVNSARTSNDDSQGEGDSH
ncbi:MAG: CDP-diacylglycerol--glycerol-3-phosphate 3-phosphatidyltransferase [Planctomycetota bacterium]